MRWHPMRWLFILLAGLMCCTPFAMAEPSYPPPHPPLPTDSTSKLGDDLEQIDMYGVVLEVKNTHQTPAGPFAASGEPQDTIQKVKVRLDSTEKIKGLKGEVITVDNVIGSNPAYNIPLKPGARVLLNMERNLKNGEWHFYIANRDRTPAILILGAVTILALLLIGGVEVAKHMLLIVLILLGCYQFLFPTVLSGQGGLFAILAMCFAFTLLGSLIYSSSDQTHRRFSKTQSVVILSTLGGLAIMALIMAVMHWITPLDGYTSEGLAALWYRSSHMDYWALYMATVLLGYQGFIFYLCWMLSQTRRQANGVQEERLNFVERFKIAMLRGKRALGPLVSSLGLLFLGLYLPILLQLQGTSTAQFINLESTASTLTVAFAGGLTLVLTVPLTALISAWIFSQEGS